MGPGIRPQWIKRGTEVLEGQALRILPPFLPKALERVIGISEGHVDAGTRTAWRRDPSQHLQHLRTTPSSGVHPSTITGPVVRAGERGRMPSRSETLRHRALPLTNSSRP